MICYQRCIYDSSKIEGYEYVTTIEQILGFLDSVTKNPLIHGFLDMYPNRGYVRQGLTKQEMEKQEQGRNKS